MASVMSDLAMVQRASERTRVQTSDGRFGHWKTLSGKPAVGGYLFYCKEG